MDAHRHRGLGDYDKKMCRKLIQLMQKAKTIGEGDGEGITL